VQLHVLDRIEQLVAHGATLNPDDDCYGDQELKPRPGTQTHRPASIKTSDNTG